MPLKSLELEDEDEKDEESPLPDDVLQADTKMQHTANTAITNCFIYSPFRRETSVPPILLFRSYHVHAGFF